VKIHFPLHVQTTSKSILVFLYWNSIFSAIKKRGWYPEDSCQRETHRLGL